ncbi:MAG: tetratricopeptide repeat protein [Phocaeicola sp.]|uniref:tetratricopeptide repeat protein n=1 Tax=Phocaeicola TaxID=909656 RepID=UPI00234E8A75|nr:tetratricopeptide repeat protein [Phocaeicola oris]MCE2615744.1 hypothetical protein [Phocaeicola oris]
MIGFKIYNDEETTILDLIAKHRIKEALVQIHTMASESQNWRLLSDIDELQTSYNLMLDYSRKGINDPDFKEVYDKMIRKVYDLWDVARIEKSVLTDPNKYFSRIKRNYDKINSHEYYNLQLYLENYTEDMATAPGLYPDEAKRKEEIDHIKQQHELAVTELFEKVWTSSHWNDETEATMYSILNSMLISVNDLCVLVSAVTMALLKLFDIKKYMFLIKAYQHKNIMINQRAIVGLAFVSIVYDWRVILFRQAKSALEELCADEKFINNLYTIQMQLLLTRETEKIDRKMKEEIIPGMMRNTGRGQHIGFEENDDDENFNPEWEKQMMDSRLADELRAMGELQMAGADVYMSSFAQFKHYRFFKKMSHWFYPFDLQYHELSALNEFDDEKEFSLMWMLKSDLFCNSDKYSFCFNLIGAPASIRKMIVSQLNQNINNLSEEEQEQLKEQLGGQLNQQQISRQYIHDLYRFFKLWDYRNEYIDIFRTGCQLWHSKDLKDALSDIKEQKAIADYLLQNGYLDEAFTLYSTLSESDKSNSEYYQKLGYIQEVNKKLDAAINWYKKSELLHPDDKWTLRHLALCYMKTEQYRQAYDYYKQLITIDQNNLKLTMEMGRCLIMMQQFEEALPYFFKVEYLSDKPNEARRAIAWCSFVTGKHEQAQKYYELLLQEPTPKLQDWMNAGHLYQVLNMNDKAITCYKNAMNLSDSFDKFTRLYQEDEPYLKAQGLSEEKIRILPDELL